MINPIVVPQARALELRDVTDEHVARYSIPERIHAYTDKSLHQRLWEGKIGCEAVRLACWPDAYTIFDRADVAMPIPWHLRTKAGLTVTVRSVTSGKLFTYDPDLRMTVPAADKLLNSDVIVQARFMPFVVPQDVSVFLTGWITKREFLRRAHRVSWYGDGSHLAVFTTQLYPMAWLGV